jgi:hypothetical protein
MKYFDATLSQVHELCTSPIDPEDSLWKQRAARLSLEKNIH